MPGAGEWLEGKSEILRFLSNREELMHLEKSASPSPALPPSRPLSLSPFLYTVTPYTITSCGSGG